jgi:hypothetical protein
MVRRILTMNLRLGLLSLLCVALLGTTSAAIAGEGDRLQRALDWPKVDLENYDTLYIEDVQVTDPMKEERKNQDLVQTVPQRMANFIAFSADQDLFPKIERRSRLRAKKG